ncbi:MAG: pilus assembly PilX N-terminal domain-containing protein [Vicinamibacteria bacterium]
MRDARRAAGGEQGFALILAILSLMLLTFLGLTLAATTSTELQIATNYRWSQQALYNAEAGIEAGKALLVSMSWGQVLPVPRMGPGDPSVCSAPTCWTGATAPTAAGRGTAPRFTGRTDEWGNPARNFESWGCDSRGDGVGYGIVLDDGSAAAPYQYKNVVFGQPLNGAFTLWIRRPVRSRADGFLEDYGEDDDTLVLVSEGVAPFTGTGITSAIGAGHKAVQLLEVTVSRAARLDPSTCGSRAGQAGGGPLGAGFDPCSNLTGGSNVTNALGGAATGTGAELNSNQ